MGRWVAAAGGIAALLALFASSPGAPEQRLALGYASDRALVRALAATDTVVLRKLADLRVAEVRTRQAQRLRRQPGITFVQRPAARRSASEPALAVAGTGAVLQWQYRATRTDAVPESVVRAASSVRIAVIDTGADLAAPDLAAKGPRAYNTRTGNADVRDPNGHGTFVASVAAGSVTNGDGIAGAGGDAQLLVVKSGSSSGAFTDVDEAAGIMYAVNNGARILNLSVGGPTTSATERRAIEYAVEHGALVVAAVGNEYEHGNPVEYPAALVQPAGSNGVGGSGLAVTASTYAGQRASFANTGSWVSLAAPGENVFGAVSQLSSSQLYPRTELPGAKGGLYGFASGTSFAAPQVAGTAALVWAANPKLTAQQVAQILKQTASGRGTWTPELGFGVVDAAAAVARAQAGVPGVLLSAKRSNRRVTLTWSGDGSSYTLSLSTDYKPARVVLAATTQTSTSVDLTPGHTYAFTVAALDAAGATRATSAPVTVTVAAVRRR